MHLVPPSPAAGEAAAATQLSAARSLALLSLCVRFQQGGQLPGLQSVLEVADRVVNADLLQQALAVAEASHQQGQQETASAVLLRGPQQLGTGQRLLAEEALDLLVAVVHASAKVGTQSSSPVAVHVPDCPAQPAIRRCLD